MANAAGLTIIPARSASSAGRAAPGLASRSSTTEGSTTTTSLIGAKIGLDGRVLEGLAAFDVGLDSGGVERGAVVEHDVVA